MYKMTACCAVGYTNHNETSIHQINLKCTFYINHAVDQRNIQIHELMCCGIYKQDGSRTKRLA